MNSSINFFNTQQNLQTKQNLQTYGNDVRQRNNTTKPLRLPTKGYSDSKARSAVIVTVVGGRSYDDLLRSKIPEAISKDTCVSLFQVDYNHLKDLLTDLKKNENVFNEVNDEVKLEDEKKEDEKKQDEKKQDEKKDEKKEDEKKQEKKEDEKKDEEEVLIQEKKVEISEIVNDLLVCDPSSILINFECCGSCSDAGFPSSYRKEVLELIQFILSIKGNVQFADFSLKALIKDWDPELLGPHAFVNVGSFSSNFDIEFIPDQLKKSFSAQLKTVGELCSLGKAHVHAMGGTILYNLNPKLSSNSYFDVEVLTIMTKCDGHGVNGYKNLTQLDNGRIKGLLSHVILHYKGKGKIIASGGHWIELSKLGLTQDNVLEVAEKRYGKTYRDNLETNWSKLGKKELDVQMNLEGANYVQSSTNCNYQSSSTYMRRTEAVKKSKSKLLSKPNLFSKPPSKK